MEQQITWNDLTTDEQEALREVGDGKQLDYPMWRALSDKGLLIVTHDQKYNRKDELTLGGRAVLAQSTATAPTSPAVGGGGEDDPVALRVEIARLQAALVCIRDYPTVEQDMDLGHQVSGMQLQAEVALEDIPPKSGLLSILNQRAETLQTELAAARSREAALKTAVTTALEYVTSAWDKNDASVVVRDYRYLTETLNFIEAALQDALFESNQS